MRLPDLIDLNPPLELDERQAQLDEARILTTHRRWVREIEYRRQIRAIEADLLARDARIIRMGGY